MRWWFAAVLLSSGCAEEVDRRVPARLRETVQVSKVEPGPFCRNLGALEGHSENGEETPYESAYETLRSKAVERGGNYVVIDLVSGPHFVPPSSDEVAIQGRLYACPLGLPAAAPASDGLCR
jgi:hypothetical protein